MRFGVLTFVTDEGIGPVELGTALEQRGFESLFLAEHSHIPVNAQSGGPASFRRIAGLNAGWLSMSQSADALSGQLSELRAVANHDVPVINVHMGQLTANEVERYQQLGVEHVLVELETEPRDQTLRRLDELQAEFAQLA